MNQSKPKLIEFDENTISEISGIVAKAFIQKIVTTIGILATIYVVIALIMQPDYDTTDGPNSRSGMALHVDNLTGCEYLSIPKGGITPRVNEFGEQLGCKRIDETKAWRN